MDFTEFKTKLNIKLGDTDNFAFTSEEKDEILTEAIQDPYVVKTVWDSSLTFTEGTWQYNVPATLTAIKDIYTKRTSEGEPETIDVSWEVIDGVLQFKGGSRWLTDGTTLYLRGNYKYTIDDTIDDIRTQQYVLNHAQLLAMDEIGIKKILKFVKNDTSVSEIIAMKQQLERKVMKHRASLPAEYQGA